MIAFKKKQKTAAVSTYHWRPNFRDFESLPDLRVVRARFFLPTLFISASTFFIAFILFREYQAISLNEGIANLSAEIDSYKKVHDEKVDLNGKFMKSVKTFEEIEAFNSDQISGSEMLLRLTSHATPGFFLTRVVYSDETGATVEGKIVVQAEDASRVVNSYIESLRSADATQGQFKSYSLASMARDAKADSLDFRIEITNEEEKKPTKKR